MEEITNYRNFGAKVDFLSIKKISIKLGFDLFGKSKVLSFITKWSASEIVFLTIYERFNRNSSRNISNFVCWTYLKINQEIKLKQ